jgi:hypothetical protein
VAQDDYRGVPVWEILRFPTGLYGYSIYHPGLPPHDHAETFSNLETLMFWVDAHKERIWEDVDDPEGRVVRISTAYVPGSLRDRMAKRRVFKKIANDNCQATTEKGAGEWSGGSED